MRVKTATALFILAVLPLTKAAPGQEPSPRPSESDNGRVVVAQGEPGTNTAAIQRAIDSGATEVVIPFRSEPWVVDALLLRSGLKLHLEPGVRLEARPGGFRGKHDALLTGHEVKDVTISGRGASLIMRRADYATTDYEPSEWRHGINLRGCSNVTIEGLTITETGGDGIYIGPTWDARRVPCTSIAVRNCIMDGNYRQGVSITSADNVVLENCVFSRTGGTNPQAGLDLEPANFKDLMSNIRVKNCRSIGNIGSGFIAALSRLDSRSTPISVYFESCTVQDSVSHLVQSSIGADPPTGFVLFRDCVFENSPNAGLRAAWESAPAHFSLRFENCQWRNVAGNYRRAPFALDLVQVEQYSKSGGIHFVKCSVFDERARHVLDISGAIQPDIKGRIGVVNPQSGAAGRNAWYGELFVYYADSEAGLIDEAVEKGHRN